MWWGFGPTLSGWILNDECHGLLGFRAVGSAILRYSVITCGVARSAFQTLRFLRLSPVRLSPVRLCAVRAVGLGAVARPYLW